MSEVNADGVLVNPQEHILQQVQTLTNSLMAERPQGAEEEEQERPVLPGGQPGGEVGGAPHLPADAPMGAARSPAGPRCAGTDGLPPGRRGKKAGDKVQGRRAQEAAGGKQIRRRQRQEEEQHGKYQRAGYGGDKGTGGGH